MTTNTGFEQPRIPAGSSPRERRAQAQMAGGHSVLKELGLGTNDPESALHVVKETAGASLLLERIQASVNSGSIQSRKSRGTLDDRAAVVDDDDLLTISSYAYVGDNNSYQEVTRIDFEVDGSVSDASRGAPSRMVFRTCNGSGLFKRMRIDKDGNVGIGMDDPDQILEIGGIFHISSEVSTPSAPADGDGGLLYVKTDGKPYWRSNELGETDLSADTNTMGSGFVLEDGDGTEVTVTESKEVKFVEGTGIDINWTDVSPGSDSDPYDLTFTVNLEGTELVSTGETGGSKFLREDGDGTCSWQTVSGSGGMTSFQLEDGDGTEVAISDAKEVKFVEGGGIDINWTDTSTGSDGDPYDLTFTVADTTVAGDSGSTGITPGDTLTIAGGTNVTTAMSGDTLTVTSTDTNTQLSTEQVQDIVGAMFSSNTETRCTVTYQDGDGTIDVEVDDLDTNLTTEQVQDIVGAMFSSNTETRITATYEDGDGTIDLVVTDMTADTQLTTEQVQDIVGGMLTGNTETRIAVTYEDGDGTIDFVVDDMSGGGISWDGSTAQGVATFKDSDEATVESNLTFDGNSLLVVTGSASAIPCTIRGAFSQSADLLVVEKSDGSDYFSVNSVGTFVLGLAGTRSITTKEESGTNTAGKDIFVKGGKSTGNGEGGDVRFYTSPAGSSGSSVNNWAEALKIRHDKVVDFKIAEVADSGSDYAYDSKVLKIKVNGTDYFLQLYAETGGGGMP